jgi:hydrogenase nickel incorporation protein HypB
MKITIEEKVLSENDSIARDNRNLLAQHCIYCCNVISSPGSGKTSILETFLKHLSGLHKAYVLIGDVQTDNDAMRIINAGYRAKQIITGGACHLTAKVIAQYLHELTLQDMDMLIIENVGNLVCPAAYDLGEDDKIVVLSVAEGEDKPMKYPSIFSKASLMLLHKIDLLPHVPFNKQKAIEYAKAVSPHLEIIETSCVTGQGFQELTAWVNRKIDEKRIRSKGTT